MVEQCLPCVSLSQDGMLNFVLWVGEGGVVEVLVNGVRRVMELDEHLGREKGIVVMDGKGRDFGMSIIIPPGPTGPHRGPTGPSPTGPVILGYAHFLYVFLSSPPLCHKSNCTAK